MVRRADPRAADGPEADHVAHLFARYDATHLMLATCAPLRVLALNMPSLAMSPRAELELRVVQRMAVLMGEGRNG